MLCICQSQRKQLYHHNCHTSLQVEKPLTINRDSQLVNPQKIPGCGNHCVHWGYNGNLYLREPLGMGVLGTSRWPYKDNSEKGIRKGACHPTCVANCNRRDRSRS